MGVRKDGTLESSLGDRWHTVGLGGQSHPQGHPTHLGSREELRVDRGERRVQSSEEGPGDCLCRPRMGHCAPPPGDMRGGVGGGRELARPDAGVRSQVPGRGVRQNTPVTSAQKVENG